MIVYRLVCSCVCVCGGKTYDKTNIWSRQNNKQSWTSHERPLPPHHNDKQFENWMLCDYDHAKTHDKTNDRTKTHVKQTIDHDKTSHQNDKQFENWMLCDYHHVKTHDKTNNC